MSIHIFSSDFVPKYVNGNWIWDNDQQRIQFKKRNDPREYIPESISWKKFKKCINQAEESLFVEKFWRKASSENADVIILQDIKNLVLFLALDNCVNNRFVEFFHTPIVDEFLNDLIIYFEHYFKFLDFLVIKRKCDGSAESKLHTNDVVTSEKLLSEYMDQYRKALSREYCQILLGADGATRFHHMANPLKFSYKNSDLNLMETFTSFCVQMTWIAMHRRDFDAIDFEISRLLRSNHFNVVRSKGLKLTSYEERLLYGKKCNKIGSSLQQRSPLATEFLDISAKDIKYIWPSQLKCNGITKKLIEFESEFVAPDAHLISPNVSHGILGHPRKFYNTMLQLNRDALRPGKFSLDHEPGQLKGQPFIIFPNPAVTSVETTLPSVFPLKKKIDKDEIRRNILMWKSKNKILKSVDLSKCG